MASSPTVLRGYGKQTVRGLELSATGRITDAWTVFAGAVFLDSEREHSDDLDAARLQWRLYAALTDASLLARPAMSQMAAYLAGGDPLKPWSLAGELAGVFEKYQAWRRDWLLRWDDGADPDDPQAILWRAAMAGRRHRASRIQDYLARFADGEARPAGLPTRL